MAKDRRAATATAATQKRATRSRSPRRRGQAPVPPTAPATAPAALVQHKTRGKAHITSPPPVAPNSEPRKRRGSGVNPIPASTSASTTSHSDGGTAVCMSNEGKAGIPPTTASLPLQAHAGGRSRLVGLVVPLLLLLVVLPLAMGLRGVPSAGNDDQVPAIHPVDRMRTLAVRAADILRANAALVAPPSLLGAAALLTQWGDLVRLPERVQWLVGGALLVLACSMAAYSSGGPMVGWHGGSGSGSSGMPPSPAALRVEEFRIALRGLVSSAPLERVPATSAAMDRVARWAEDWQGAAASGGAARKLLLFGNVDGSLAKQAAELAASTLLPAQLVPTHVLSLHAPTDCNRGRVLTALSTGCAERIESTLAAASAAGERALVVLSGVDSCSSDAMCETPAAGCASARQPRLQLMLCDPRTLPRPCECRMTPL